MTQNRPPAKKFVPPKAPPGLLPTPGMAVRLKDHPQHTGVVREHDDWWDLLLLRGVDIADQVLVDWGTPTGTSVSVVRWERISQLEEVSDPAATPAPEKEGDA
jgi:hypothetical protein